MNRTKYISGNPEYRGECDATTYTIYKDNSSRTEPIEDFNRWYAFYKGMAKKYDRPSYHGTLKAMNAIKEVVYDHIARLNQAA